MDAKLILAPLSEITDEDAIIAAEHVGAFSLRTRNITKIEREEDGVVFTYNWVDNEIGLSHSAYKLYFKECIKDIGAIDFLRSKGYALPYMDIDLFESGIAIPNNKMK